MKNCSKKLNRPTKQKRKKNDDTDFVISRDAEQAVLQSLKKFESGRKFLEKDLDLTKLAGHFNTNTKYLSLIILRHRNLKFYQYINSLKIDYIAKRIRNEKILQNYTHEALALEAGYSTTRRFVNAFVSYTGITPKYFIEELRKEENIG
ncbi:helix-turn-helix domain-containing protein [Flavobacterium sp.]|uniref:helix-turn-helix domain-containing protein n=1 Tax=Flavobacterium sp. TaxID=239 RepID=UPI0031E21A1C